MLHAAIDGIDTVYEVVGEGEPLLMFSPGGFDAGIATWATQGIYRRLDLVPRLAEHHRCILFDRREAGGSGGRIERLSWAAYVRQAVGLLDHLEVDRAHLIGGCVGCSTAAALAVSHPDRVRSIVLWAPAGGARYRLKQHQRFAGHVAFAASVGTGGVVDHVLASSDGFSADPRVGPFAAAIRNSADFAAELRALTDDNYVTIVQGAVRTLFDRDTVPGVEPEDLMGSRVPALVVPGEDTSHAPSAAHHLLECLPEAQWWEPSLADLTGEEAAEGILRFLAGSAARSR